MPPELMRWMFSEGSRGVEEAGMPFSQPKRVVAVLANSHAALSAARHMLAHQHFNS